MAEHLYPHMVQEYYVARLREIAATRAAELAAVRTRADVARLRSKARRGLRRAFAPFPKRTPLDVRITGRVRRRHYTIENLIYHSRPGLPVTANLYLPRGSGPFPAVLGTCGHSGNGRMYDLYQASCRGLVRQGYVVLIYDPLSQGERLQYPRKQGRPHPVGCCHEHNMMGNQMSLVGQFFGTWRLWDGVRGLDYLLSRPEVDRTRVGLTGNSGGGTMTTYLNGLDDRFTMAAPSCFVTTYLCNMENELPADSEQTPPNMLRFGLDTADFFTAQIPRPVLLLGQKDDFFDCRGLREIYEELRRLYAIVGAEDAVELFIGPQEHGFSIHNREAMLRFFNRHAGVDASGREARGPLAKDETLWATPSGQVHRMRGVRRVFDFTRDTAQALATTRRCVGPDALRRLLPRLLNLPRRRGVPHHRVLRQRPDADRRHVHHSSFAVETEPGIQAILHLWSKTSGYFHLPDRRQATVYVPHVSSLQDVTGRQVPRRDDELFSVDVRGLGQSTALTCNDTELFSAYGNDYFYAAHGQMLGESYLGRRVHDLLAVLDLLDATVTDHIHLIGRGMGALLATFAACLHPAVKRVTLKNALLSYHDLTQVPVQSWPLSSLPFGVLRHGDLPDCYRALAPKRLTIVEPWTSQMRVWKPDALRRHVKTLGLGARCVRV